ncbi:hypothetical protein B0H17DRAFT_1190846 [Mycena rosella]|uniref:MYND-type domain-containing protein n=1 Tax=Mycena rosella TaxID=1033263 RepID=A0AAD7H1A8_MYCRO|nr:hypothetical protein B0H17DRAFT_1190846 [Mycena rosella]
MSKNGKALFIDGEHHYEAGRIPEAFETYRRAVIQIVDHEDVLQKIPGVPAHFPQEMIALIWQNFIAIFRESGSPFTRGKRKLHSGHPSAPEAYDLVYAFRPSGSSRAHPEFKGPQGKRLLKAMQIIAGFALAILAWNEGDRSTAAKRYQEALDIAATHPPFNAVTPGLMHLDRIVAFEVQEIRKNLAILIDRDAITAEVAGSNQGGLRKEVLNVPHTRIGDDGNILAQQGTFVVATDAGCKKIAYCGVECQKADWKKHKTTH